MVNLSIDRVAGFEIVHQSYIVELEGTAILLRHIRTGAEILSIHNHDANKVFSIAFRTPPDDSTGVAHILEHSVLCGSEKYPVKEPFVELIKGSLKTFLNAFTFSDKTVYPVASQHIDDFYNLINVYLDAVFFPLIPPTTLQQEGWHLEVDQNRSLFYKGVVYNEMKGAYSDPERLPYEMAERMLLPDTCYQHSSGGDPECIPQLSYEQFKDFHTRYYHPSNSRIFFYGDDPLERRLEVISSYLDRFERSEVDSIVALQEPFTEPLSFTYEYDGGSAGDQTDGTANVAKGMYLQAWALPEPKDLIQSMAYEILAEILMGSSAAPLAKALEESHLGEKLLGGAVDLDVRQPIFSVGLKNFDLTKVLEVQRIITDTLQEIERHGISEEALSGILNSYEFQWRENHTGAYPRGLIIGLRVLTRWLHGDDPVRLLRLEDTFNSVKRLFLDWSLLQSLVRGLLIDNPHRVSITLEPKYGLNGEKDAAEAEKLRTIAADLSSAEIDAIDQDATLLKELQARPDSAESLALIPSLTLAQLERNSKVIPKEVASLSAGGTLLFRQAHTSGITYLDLAFEASRLNTQDLAMLGIFSGLLFELGVKDEHGGLKYDHSTLVQRIQRETGGFKVSPWVLNRSAANGNRSPVYLLIRGKVLSGREQVMLSILTDVLNGPYFENRDRVLQLVKRQKAMMENHVISRGHSFALMRVSSMVNHVGWISECLSGIEQLRFLRQLERRIQSDWEGVVQDLNRVLGIVIARDRVTLNVTADSAHLTSAVEACSRFADGLSDGNPPRGVEWPLMFPKQNQAIIIPSLVNYVAKAGDLYSSSYRDSGASSVITRIIKSQWLWNKVRVEGGAYGAFCSFNRLTGLFAQYSYRDPNIRATIDAFDSTAAFLRSTEFSQDDLRKAIIGTIGEVDDYQFPDEEGLTSLSRHLQGIEIDDIQQRRIEILETSVDDFRIFGSHLAELLTGRNMNDTTEELSSVVVIGSAKKIEADEFVSRHSAEAISLFE
jgi:hypothetical protein